MKKIINLAILVIIVICGTLLFFRSMPPRSQDVIGKWEVFYISDDYLSRHKLDKGKFASQLLLEPNGTFEAINIPLSEASPPWSGKGSWKFETEATPKPDGTPMLHLDSNSASSDNVDCWIEVKNGLVEKILSWEFDVIHNLKIDYKRIEK